MTRTHTKRSPKRSLSSTLGGFGLAAVALIFLFSLVNVAAAGSAAQPAPGEAPDPGPNKSFYNTKFMTSYCTQSNFPGYCVKTIKIQNDTPFTIYPVLEANPQSSGKSTKCTHADLWLQAAFGDQNDCYVGKFVYHVYINGTNGIPAGQSATVDVPFWSQRDPSSQISGPPDPDVYIDWWNGARLYVFDDSTALQDSYTVDYRYPLNYIPSSPQVVCDANGGACNSTEAYIACAYQDVVNHTGCIVGSNTVKPETPQQLNEFTYSSVDPVDGLVNFNVNYNVSNVDQVYLPIAIEPTVWPSQNVNTTNPYLGSILDAVTYRKNLGTFTGAGYPPGNPTQWPIYTVHLDNMGHPLYPTRASGFPARPSSLRRLLIRMAHCSSRRVGRASKLRCRPSLAIRLCPTVPIGRGRHSSTT